MDNCKVQRCLEGVWIMAVGRGRFVNGKTLLYIVNNSQLQARSHRFLLILGTNFCQAQNPQICQLLHGFVDIFIDLERISMVYFPIINYNYKI